MDDPFIIQNEDKTIKDKQVQDYDDRGLDGGFLFGLGERSNSLQILISKRRFFWFCVIIFISLAVLLARVFYLQVGRGSYYRNIAEGNRIRIKPVRAMRGVIWDRNGQLLTQNIPKFSLYFIPADLPEEDEGKNQVLGVVAEILEKPLDEIQELVADSWQFSYEPVLIEDDVTRDVAILLNIESASLAGIFLETTARREYVESEAGLAHILGYTSKLTGEEFSSLKEQGYLIDDYLGRTGVERTYEPILRGAYGWKKVEVDFLGKEESVLSAKDAERGQDLILSIDLELQKKAAAVLEKYAREFKSNKGAVIINNVNTGELLALVSLPDYDNNLFALGIKEEEYQQLIEDEDKPLFNRAVSGEYPPGSTFKLSELAGALEDEIVDKDTHVFSSGGIGIGEWYFPDWKAGGHGRVTAPRAIAESVNTYFYYVGGGFPSTRLGTSENFFGLGVERINHWAYLFGMGQELGIDLLGEEDGFLPTKQWKLKYKGEPWYIGDTYHLAIGQGDVLVTPLQVVSYTGAIANGGTLYKPRVVRGRFDNEAGLSTQLKAGESFIFEPEIIRQDFVKDENLAIIREGMRDAVIYGTCKGLSRLGKEVTGKTGTAQVGGDKESHAWFTGFAPYLNPEIAITVLVENGGEGGRVAVPIAREILQYYFQNKK